MTSRSTNRNDLMSSRAKAPQRPHNASGPLAPSPSASEVATPPGLPSSPSSGRSGRYKQRSSDTRNQSPTVKNISSRARSPATPSTSEDPATEGADEDDSYETSETSIGERELVAMLRKVDKKSRRNQAKYTAMKDSVENTSEQLLRLEDSYANLMNQMGELEALCTTEELDEDAIDKIFQAISHEQ